MDLIKAINLLGLTHTVKRGELQQILLPTYLFSIKRC